MLPGFLPMLAFLLVAALVVALAKSLLVSKEPPPTTFPYEKEPHLFSPAERSFLGVLEQAVGDQYRIMGKVHLADIIKVAGVNGKGWQSAFNRIQAKHVDFVVCNATDLAVQYVIELDDQTHNRPKRQARDEFIDTALHKAGVPIFHFTAKRSYAVHEVTKALTVRKSIVPGESVPAEKTL